MPSSDVVEISQTFYWPLYTRPIDWMYQRHLGSDKTLAEKVQRVADELNSLDFMQAKPEDEQKAKELNSTEATPTGDATNEIIDHLQQVKEDWFSDLSGGQKSKVELVRMVRYHLCRLLNTNIRLLCASFALKCRFSYTTNALGCCSSMKPWHHLTPRARVL